MSEEPQLSLEEVVLAIEEQKRSPRASRSHLRAVETGELDPDGPQTLGEAIAMIRKQALELEGLAEAHRSAMAKVRHLRLDRDQDARQDGLWPLGLEAFAFWKAETGHGKSEFTTARFELSKPYLARDGIEVVKLAISGAAFDPYRADKPGRNGITAVYDSWETIFKNRGAFERHANRAPRERIAALKAQGAMPKIDALELRVKAEVILATELIADTRPMCERVRIAVVRAHAELTSRRTRE